MQTDSVAVGLRLVELIALLLPAVAIVVNFILQRLFREEENPFDGWAAWAFGAFATATVGLLSVAIETLNRLATRVQAPWLVEQIEALSSWLGPLILGMAGLLAKLFLTGRSGEEPNSEDDDPPKGIE